MDWGLAIIASILVFLAFELGFTVGYLIHPPDDE